jgi:hypothetical protein
VRAASLAKGHHEDNIHETDMRRKCKHDAIAAYSDICPCLEVSNLSCPFVHPATRTGIITTPPFTSDMQTRHQYIIILMFWQVLVLMLLQREHPSGPLFHQSEDQPIGF